MSSRGATPPCAARDSRGLRVSRRCHGHTINQRRCKRQRTGTVGSQYCRQHRQMYRLERPDDCSVCLEPLSTNDDEIRPTRCGHYFHVRCLHESLQHNQGRCPMCRTQLRRGIQQSTTTTLEEEIPSINLDALTPDGRRLIEVVLQNIERMLREVQSRNQNEN